MVQLCSKCGAELPDGALFCIECGYRVIEIKKHNSIFLNGMFFLILAIFILIIGIIFIYII